jgi:hypothetical protein
MTRSDAPQRSRQASQTIAARGVPSPPAPSPPQASVIDPQPHPMTVHSHSTAGGGRCHRAGYATIFYNPADAAQSGGQFEDYEHDRPLCTYRRWRRVGTAYLRDGCHDTGDDTTLHLSVEPRRCLAVGVRASASPVTQRSAQNDCPTDLRLQTHLEDPSGHDTRCTRIGDRHRRDRIGHEPRALYCLQRRTGVSHRVVRLPFTVSWQGRTGRRCSVAVGMFCHFPFHTLRSQDHV